MLQTILLALFACAAIAMPVLNFFYRIGYIYIDHDTFPGLSRLIYALMVLNALGAAALFICSAAGLRFGAGAWVGFGFSVLFTILFAVMNASSAAVTENETLRSLRPALRFRFTSEPLVLDVGTGEYSVVFATNRRAWGYVTYTYNGEEKIAWCHDDGVKRPNKIFSVKIPREELENNRYQVHAVRVLELLAYGGRRGKTIHGKAYDFKGDRNLPEPKLLCITDWHFRYDEGLLAASFCKDPDLVVLVGDAADYYPRENTAVKHFISFAAQASHSEIPVIFARGNHETRASFDFGDFWRKLGLKDGYNYQVERGEFLFTVVDTAENPETADPWQYGYYVMEDYLNHVLEWLEQLPPRADKFNIVLLHDSLFCASRHEQDRTPWQLAMLARYHAALQRLHIHLSISGHLHPFVFYPERCGSTCDDVIVGGEYTHWNKHNKKYSDRSKVSNLFPHPSDVHGVKEGQLELLKDRIVMSCLRGPEGLDDAARQQALETFESSGERYTIVEVEKVECGRVQKSHEVIVLRR